MAKRDRDTDIWKDKFYRGLPPLYKCFWDYINDECDNAGVWIEDLATAKLRIGKRIDRAKAIDLFGDRVKLFDGGNKWHIKTFISEKLGFTDLNPNHRFQKSIIELLARHKIDKIKGYPDGIQTPMGMGKDMGVLENKKEQAEIVEEKLLELDEIYLDQQKHKWPHLDFAYQLETFIEKVRGSPEFYYKHSDGGIRLAFQKQLREAKAKQPNGKSFSKNDRTNFNSTEFDIILKHGGGAQ